MRRKKTYIGFDTILNIWYSGHDIVQRGDICDDGFLVGMGHIHIYREKKRGFQVKKSYCYFHLNSKGKRNVVSDRFVRILKKNILFTLPTYLQ